MCVVLQIVRLLSVLVQHRLCVCVCSASDCSFIVSAGSAQVVRLLSVLVQHRLCVCVVCVCSASDCSFIVSAGSAQVVCVCV